MEKNARVEEGKTPSIHSGRASETTKDGEAICEDEMEKKAVYELNDPKIKEVWKRETDPFTVIDTLNESN